MLNPMCDKRRHVPGGGMEETCENGYNPKKVAEGKTCLGSTGDDKDKKMQRTSIYLLT